MESAWTGFMLSLSLCLDLGIVNVAVLRTAMQQGGHVAFALGLGSAVGDLIYFTMAALGAASLARWRPFRFGLWLFGSAVLIWLAWKMIRTVANPKALDLSEPAPRLGYGAALAAGIGLALASPTAILWFAAVGGSVIASSSGHGNLWAVGSGFGAAGVLFSAGLAYGAAALRQVAGLALVRIVSLASALLFLYFAGRVFFGGFKEFVL
jgi:L-lysine exporter family protein LysE/ArgO